MNPDTGTEKLLERAAPTDPDRDEASSPGRERGELRRRGRSGEVHAPVERMSYRKALGLLFSRSTGARLLLANIGTIALAFADAVGVLLVMPLMQLLTGSPQDQGTLGFISGLLGDPPRNTLAIYLAVITFGTFLVKGTLAICFRWWVLGFISKQDAATSTRLLQYYLEAPYGLHLRRSSADLIRTMNDAVRSVYSQVVSNGINIISEVLTMVAVAVALIVVAPVPAMLLVAYFVVAVGLFYRLIRPMAHRAGVHMVETWETIYLGAMHALGGIKEIKIRHKSDYFLQKYAAARLENAEAQRRGAFVGDLPKYVFEVVFILGIGAVMVVVFATTPSSDAVGVLAVMAAAGYRLLPSATRLTSAMGAVRLGRPSLDVVLADLELAKRDEAPEVDDNVPALRVHDGIELDRVTFFHDGRDVPAVHDVSFTIPSGSSAALVGASGAGKSTLVDILLGLYQPFSGRVCADGVDISQVLPAWQRGVGLVPQDVYLLDDSLRANIAFGESDDEIDEQQLQDAIVAAQLVDFVAELPEGLDTFVGERGVRLSGGQRQRIGIARALYTRPSLLILDEATSALDNETEKRVASTISALHGQVTVILVAHRLSTVRDVDQVVFLDEGRVADIGGFRELQLVNDDFARLVELGRLA